MAKEIAEFDKIKIIASKFYEVLKPCKIYLFGSFVRGEQNYHSDYDFYVVVNDKNYGEDLVMKARKSIRGMKRRPVDIIVASESNFSQKLSLGFSFEKTIVNEGVLLHA